MSHGKRQLNTAEYTTFFPAFLLAVFSRRARAAQKTAPPSVANVAMDQRLYLGDL